MTLWWRHNSPLHADSTLGRGCAAQALASTLPVQTLRRVLRVSGHLFYGLETASQSDLPKMFGLTFALYVQAFPGHAIVGVPELGVSERINGRGFDHPRMPVGNFEAADSALKGAIQRIAPPWPRRLGRLLFHIQHEWEGGLTEVELRAVKDLSTSAGATSVNVYIIPKDLSDAEIQRLLRAKRGSEPGLT